MTIPEDRLGEISHELRSRPGHEKVRALVFQLLVDGLGVPSTDVHFERPLAEVRGRMDALLGRTVLEFKRDLRRELSDAESGLTRYLTDREATSGERYLGIATDGADFAAYEMRRGVLARLPGFSLLRGTIGDLLAWLDGAVSVRNELEPTQEAVRRELGRASLAFERARASLVELWNGVVARPDAQLRRQLWADLLARVYGARIDEDALFVQHTYLTIVAKTMATRVLGVPLPRATDLLAGTAFADVGIHGAVESDFFDWVLDAPGGPELVERIARQAVRFRLADVEADVLKGLYESLIDPDQRHDLGEYYTPDWLAALICDRVIDDPFHQRVLDPACGSGTFLFHAVRRSLAAAIAAGMTPSDAVARCCGQVLGIDVHPVAAIIARVTYLLAIGEERLRERPAIAVPVYLGDSLQWNTRGFLAEREVLIDVPGASRALFFPFVVTRDPALFDAVINGMLAFSEQDADDGAFIAWLERQGIGDASDQKELAATYGLLRELHRSGRDHIWGYVARNLSRPIWLSSAGQRPDVIIGNPPWLAYRYMNPATQHAFRDESMRLGVWVGGAGRVSHQDLSGYFFARCVELYLDPGGRIAFVMPFAALTRHHFAKFRSGRFSSGQGRPKREQVFASVRFIEAWGLDESVQPLFPVPASVLIGVAGESGSVPDAITMFAGTLPRRDATPVEAERALRTHVQTLGGAAAEGSPYRERFREGAIVVPRVLFVVERVEVGRLGGDPATPLVRSRRSSLEKSPWRELPGLEGRVESTFLRPLYLGESIAPYRLLDPPLGVIPWDAQAGRLLDRDAARTAGHIHLSAWLSDVEEAWRQHGKRAEPLTPRLDYFGQLRAQFPGHPVRIVYAASGTLPAAAVLRDPAAVVEHKLYWAAATDDEARYLEAILNSETARAAAEHRQSRGQWGARDFDKVMLELPIPTFKPAAHSELVALAYEAEALAADVLIPPGFGFVRARSLVRARLIDAGVAQAIERLVERLIGIDTSGE